MVACCDYGVLQVGCSAVEVSTKIVPDVHHFVLCMHIRRSGIRFRMLRDLVGWSCVVYRLFGHICIVSRFGGSDQTVLQDYERSDVGCRTVHDFVERSGVVYGLFGRVCINRRSEESGRTVLRDYGRFGIRCRTVHDLAEQFVVRSGLSGRVEYYLDAVCHARCHDVPMDSPTKGVGQSARCSGSLRLYSDYLAIPRTGCALHTDGGGDGTLRL